ncbi:hypothetical protein [Nocardia bovistercoris]|uniref:Uncharacterized protein n=1 Tax=Nocardia bovistercoris TaxID=2785916 RepID=A0A931IGS4_9NOCA|nr:hypothetical protein [Nocardia bovistercoris]MBH0781139.1 hypothetical protein [Nocardia bovistercoris]
MTVSVRIDQPTGWVMQADAPRRCRTSGEGVSVPPVGETFEQRCRRYARLDLPVEYDRARARILLDPADARICTVVVPSRLGVDAAARDGSPRGPVIHDTRERVCVFLAGAPRWSDHLSSAAVRSGVEMGGVCVLPSPLDEATGVRRWLVPPMDGYVPSMHLVLAAIREARR